MPTLFGSHPRAKRGPPVSLFSGATLLVFACFATEARADVSSWFYAGGGASSLSSTADSTSRPGTLQMELGMGSPPHGAVVIGGLVKMMTFFSHGSDLAVVTRGASGGFVRGGFGFAIDAGAYQRWWAKSRAASSVRSCSELRSACRSRE